MVRKGLGARWGAWPSISRRPHVRSSECYQRRRLFSETSAQSKTVRSCLHKYICLIHWRVRPPSNAARERAVRQRRSADGARLHPYFYNLRPPFLD
eukprot:46546-Prymnesium_polylepis.1